MFWRKKLFIIPAFSVAQKYCSQSSISSSSGKLRWFIFLWYCIYTVSHWFSHMSASPNFSLKNVQWSPQMEISPFQSHLTHQKWYFALHFSEIWVFFSSCNWYISHPAKFLFVCIASQSYHQLILVLQRKEKKLWFLDCYTFRSSVLVVSWFLYCCLFLPSISSSVSSVLWDQMLSLFICVLFSLFSFFFL